MSKGLVSGLIILGQILLGVFFGFNLSQLYQKYLSTQDALNRQLLTTDIDRLTALIRSAGVSWWLWVITIIGLVVTLGFLVAWCFPRLRQARWFYRANWIWLTIWLVYFGVSLVTLIVAFNRLF